MGKKINASFFSAKDMVFVGYSKKQEAFCAMVADAFREAGTTVYPVNPSGSWNQTLVYESIEKVPVKPELAYVLTNKKNTASLIGALKTKGVKKIVFQSGLSVDKQTLQTCADAGLETAVACPMMALGRGFHRFHGFLAGVKR